MAGDFSRRDLFRLRLGAAFEDPGEGERVPRSAFRPRRPPAVKVYAAPSAPGPTATSASGPTASPAPGSRATSAPGPAATSVAIAPAPPRAAIAFLDTERCLPFCSVCVERCPVRGALTMQAGRVQIDRARCDGCGVCAEVCPAPTPAIEMLALD